MKTKLPPEPKSKKTISFGIAVIVLFVGGFGLWAVFSPLESASLAPGKIIVAGHHQTIQHLEGGIITALFIKDGSIVKKGQPLIQLDNIRAKATAEIHKNYAAELLAMEARLVAERSNAETINFPQRLLANAANPNIKKIMDDQTAIFNANNAHYDNSVTILNSRMEQLNEEIKGTQHHVTAIKTQLSILSEEIKTMAHLEKQKLVERHRLLILKREYANLNGQGGISRAKIASLRQKVSETKLQVAAIMKERDKETLTNLRDTRQKLSDILEKEKDAQHTLKRTTITAPRAGTVVGLKVHTIGGVIQPGETIMDIVPSRDQLIVEARVTPTDIDVVHKGLKAKVQLTAFKSRITPTLLGEVNHVSADIFTDDKTGEIYYLTRITIPKNELKRLKKSQKLYPGMPVEVMIITEKSTPWQYFISPIKSSFRRAFREK